MCCILSQYPLERGLEKLHREIIQSIFIYYQSLAPRKIRGSIWLPWSSGIIQYSQSLFGSQNLSKLLDLMESAGIMGAVKAISEGWFKGINFEEVYRGYGFCPSQIFHFNLKPIF